MSRFILFLIGISFLSCNQIEKDKRPKEANIMCKDFFIQGQFKNGTYTFCGIVPVENSYNYKNGKWKFWNLNGQLIAEGIYKSNKIKIEDQGGCPYEIIKGIIEKENWNFWDESGNKIPPNEELISRIENCTNEFHG